MLVDRTRYESLAKTLIFLPMSISLVGASIIWKFVYEYRPNQGNIQQIGLANQILVWLGLEPYQFLLNQPWNTFFLIAVMIWIQAGFAMTVLSAAIKAIPDDITEAARLDGLHGVGHVPVHHRAEHPARARRRHHDDRHGHAQGLRHRPDHDRRQLQHVRRGLRVLHAELPRAATPGSVPRSRSSCSSW